MLGPLKRGEGRLQVIAGGVRAALVHVGGVLAGGTEGASQVDRRHGRIVAGIVHGVDGAGREPGRFELVLLAHGGSLSSGYPERGCSCVCRRVSEIYPTRIFYAVLAKLHGG